MIVNSSYTFRASVSSDAYLNKEISGAMIGTTKDKNNKLLRQFYGFAANKGVGFIEGDYTIQTLYDSCLEGRVFCHLFNPETTRKDGSFGSSQKKDINFKGSYVIGIDIDKTNYKTAEEFIDKLTFKPSFYYSTYSNQKEGKGCRFRMIYVFDYLITNRFFFRYVATLLNKSIEKDTLELIEDDCNLRCSQYFNGTNKNNPDLVLESGITNLVYSLSDLGVCVEGFKEFLENNCGYKTNTHRTEIKALLEKINKEFFPTVEEEITEEIEETVEEVVEDTLSPSKSFISDMSRLSYDEFMTYNRHKYSYIYRQEKEEWINGCYQYVDEGYFSLFYNVNKVQDGGQRRKKLYNRMCLRRVMKPSITADELLFNAYEDLHRFFNNDPEKVKNVISVDDLVKNVEWAMSKTIEEIELDFSDTLELLRSKAPKNGIIYKTKGVQISQFKSSLLNQIMEDYYDSSKTVAENIEYISTYVFPVKKSFVYSWLKTKGISTRLSDEEVKSLLDTTLSARKNYEILKDSGIKISRNRVNDLLQQKKEEIVVEVEVEEPTQLIITNVIVNKEVKYKEDDYRISNFSFYGCPDGLSYG